MKIILAGTPQFSILPFEEIIKHFDVVAIVTQPDRKVGRHQKVVESPVKLLAKKYHLKIYQPEKIGTIKEDLKKLKADLFLTCAFGQYVPEAILEMATFKALNIHGSLLPRHRGAAPIHYTILSNDQFAGITLIRMAKKMDAGNMIFKAKIVNDSQTTGELSDQLSLLAKAKIVGWLKKYFANEYLETVQKDELVTLAPKLLKSDCLITKSDTKLEAINKIRGCNPEPKAYIVNNNKNYNVFKAELVSQSNTITFSVKDGNIYISEIQPSGKRKMSSKEFLNGYQY